MEITVKSAVFGVYCLAMSSMFAEVGPTVAASPWLFFWSGVFFMIGGTLNYHAKATIDGSISIHGLTNTLLSCGLFGACGSMITVYFIEPVGMTFYLIMGAFGVGGLVLGTPVFRRLESYLTQFLDKKASTIIDAEKPNE